MIGLLLKPLHWGESNIKQEVIINPKQIAGGQIKPRRKYSPRNTGIKGRGRVGRNC